MNDPSHSWHLAEVGRAEQKAQRAAWLQALKPGDSAALQSARQLSSGHEILTISRVTKTQVIVDGSNQERRFNTVDGSERGTNHYANLQPITLAILDANEMRDLSHWLKHEVPYLKALTLDQLRAMRTAVDAITTGGPVTTRKAFVCAACEGVYADAPTTQCDCSHEKTEFHVGEITYRKDASNAA